MRRKSSSRKLARLVAGVNLFARQQWERVVYGGGDEVDDVHDENEEVVDKVLPIVEDALDEDLLDELDDAEKVALPYTRMYSPPYVTWLSDYITAAMNPPWAKYYAPGPARVSPARRGDRLVEDTIEVFRQKLNHRIRLSNRGKKELTKADLDELVGNLKDELADVLLQGAETKTTKAKS